MISQKQTFGDKTFCERIEGCHPERGEGSLRPVSQALASLRVTGLISECLMFEQGFLTTVGMK